MSSRLPLAATPPLRFRTYDYSLFFSLHSDWRSTCIVLFSDLADAGRQSLSAALKGRAFEHYTLFCLLLISFMS